ncbi:MAG: hypothetical protein LBG73_05310 [Spirochaetaceae bacterium]|nr:hypothetical protein [Spirochaetaceae bacterium]
MTAYPAESPAYPARVTACPAESPAYPVRVTAYPAESRGLRSEPEGYTFKTAGCPSAVNAKASGISGGRPNADAEG